MKMAFSLFSRKIHHTLLVLGLLFIGCFLLSCQTDEGMEQPSPQKKAQYKDPRLVMSYYNDVFDIYNFCEAPFVHPDTIQCRIVGDGTLPYEKKHQVVPTVEHKALIDGFIKNWRTDETFLLKKSSFGIFDDSLTAVVRLTGEKAFPSPIYAQQRMKELGADLPVHYAATEGFRSVQLINPPVAIRVALFYAHTGHDEDYNYNKYREKDVTDEAYIVSFDPRVAIARGGIGENGRNLKVVRRKLTSMTAEDFRWLNADFFIDIPRKADTPRKDKGKCIGLMVYIEREDGTIIEADPSLPASGGIPVFYPEIEHDYDYAIPWFFHHNRGIRKPK